MYVESLAIKNFRCFNHKQIQLSPGINLFVGPNGQGKTSLIEALYVLLSGESFRTSDTAPLIRAGQEPPDEMLVEGKIHHGPKDHLSSRVRYSLRGKTRSVTLGGKSITSARLQLAFPKILFVPESLNAIKGAPEERRSLVDQALLQIHPQKRTIPADYKKALLQKNRLLKMMRDQEISAAQGEQTLRSLNPLFLERAFHLTMARKQLLLDLLPYLQHSFQRIYGAAVEISVEYLISEKDFLRATDGQVVNALSQALEERRRIEVQVGKSLVGPHKHDINFLFNSRDARSYCSQGQQRALVLAFQMAQIQRFVEVHGAPPLLLLDDVLSELDLEKQVHLLEYLKGLATQILITTTDLTTILQFDPQLGEVFNLGQGREKEDLPEMGEGIRV